MAKKRRHLRPVEAARPKSPPRPPGLNHGLGFKPRPGRVKEAKILYAAAMRRHHPEISDEEIARRTEALVEVLAHHDPRAVRAFERTEPSSTAPRRSAMDPLCEVLAIRRLDEVRRVEGHLNAYRPRRGFRPRVARIVAALLTMAWERRRTEFLATVRLFDRPDAQRAFCYGYPAGSGREKSASYEQLHAVCEASDVEVVVKANVDLLRRQALLKGPNGKPRHPNLGRWAAVDGSYVEPDIRQQKPVDEAHAAHLRGKRTRIGYSLKQRPSGEIADRCHGYRLVALVDLASSLPMVWALFRADAYEPGCLLVLLERLRNLWPECPLEAVVGDRLFTRNVAVARSLVFKWGVAPVFPPKGRWAASSDWAPTLGVPYDRHGPMHYEKPDNFHDGDKRLSGKYGRGQMVDEVRETKIRWVCKTCGARVNTYPDDDPTLYTQYPFGGDSLWYFRRVALLARRGAVESLFSQLQNQGFGGVTHERPAWANDHEMELLASLALLSLTARRFAYETGLYTDTFERLERLGLFVAPTVAKPTPGPSPEEAIAALVEMGFRADNVAPDAVQLAVA